MGCQERQGPGCQALRALRQQWTALAARAAPQKAAFRRELQQVPQERRTLLHGVPFAVKDNVDVAGLPTTAACPAFTYTPAQSAPAVQALLDAGAPLCCTAQAEAHRPGSVHDEPETGHMPIC